MRNMRKISKITKYEENKEHNDVEKQIPNTSEIEIDCNFVRNKK